MARHEISCRLNSGDIRRRVKGCDCDQKAPSRDVGAVASNPTPGELEAQMTSTKVDGAYQPIPAADDVNRERLLAAVLEDVKYSGCAAKAASDWFRVGWKAHKDSTQPQGGEAVAWQLRVQYEPKGVPGEWSEWQYCGLAEYEAIKRGEGYYEYRNAEARALYAYSRTHDSREAGDGVAVFNCARCPVSVESRWLPPDCPECGDPCELDPTAIAARGQGEGQ